MKSGPRNWTLQQLLDQRCIEVGNCFEWQGNINSGGHPMMSYLGKPTLARRVAWCLSHRLELSDIQGVRLWNTCANKLCINPACTRAGDYSAMFSALISQGRTKSSPSKRAKCAQTKRAASPRTIEDIRAIRSALIEGESPADLAQHYQCSVSLIEKIGHNQVWREVVPSASIFGMGGA